MKNNKKNASVQQAHVLPEIMHLVVRLERLVPLLIASIHCLSLKDEIKDFHQVEVMCRTLMVVTYSKNLRNHDYSYRTILERGVHYSSGTYPSTILLHHKNQQ